MKKSLIFLLLLCTPFLANAQNVDQQIKKIRDFYQQVQEQARKGYSIENPIGTAVIDHVANYCAIGCVKGKMEVYTYLYDEDDTEDKYFNTQQVVMIREHFERGPWTYYREYLYDPKTTDPIFCYFHDMSPDTGEIVDHRFYFSEGKLLKSIPESSASKAQSALRIAKGMRDDGRAVFEMYPTDL